MKQFSSACFLHHAFEDGVVAAVARVRDLKVVAATSRSCCHAGTTKKVSLCYFCGKTMDYEQRQKLIIFLLSKVLDNFDEVEDILSVDETMDLDIDYEYQAF